MNNIKTKIDDCEACGRTGQTVTLDHHNMWLCDECAGKEREIETRIAQANTLVTQSRKIDASIETKADLFNAATVAIIEIDAAIQADENIPDDKKDYAFVKECNTRVAQMQGVIFNMRLELNARENEMVAWQTNGQARWGKLRSDLQAEFKSLNIEYQPVKVKSVKPTAIKAPRKSGTKEAQEAKEAASKYGVPASGVQMIVKSKNISALDAAKFLAKQLGLIQ